MKKKKSAVSVFWFGFAMVFGNVLAVNLINSTLIWGELWAWVLIVIGSVMMFIVAAANNKAYLGVLTIILVVIGLYFSVTSGFKKATPIADSNGYYIDPGSLVLPINYSSTSKNFIGNIGNTVGLYKTVNEQRAQNIPLFALGAVLIAAGGVIVTFGVKDDKK